MFTAHLFERPLKQGANDNISGCVVLAEIARTITTLIKEGKIERPERSIKELSLLEKSDSGVTYANTVKYIIQAKDLSKKALLTIKDLTRDKKRLDNYLDNLIKSFDELPGYYTKILENHYKNVAAFRGFEPELAATPGEEELKHITPGKVEPVPLGKWIRFSTLFRALRKDTQLSRKIFRQYGHLFLKELYLCIDGKRTLAQIRDLVGFEFQPITAADFMKIINLLEEAKLIKLFFP